MRISDWSSDVCSSDLSCILRSTCATAENGGFISTTVGRMAAGSRSLIEAASWQLTAISGNSLESRSARTSASSLSRSEEHTSELQSLMRISYAVFCLKKKKKQKDARQRCITKQDVQELNRLSDTSER